MADLVNELVWSHSRARAAAGCPRAYWFAYYGSWGGWDAAASATARDAYVQKKLTSRAMWTGTVVHAVAEHALRQVRDGFSLGTVETAVAGARTGARRDIEGSHDGSWRQRPARRVGFREHYYEQAPTDAEWGAAIDEIERQVRGLWDNRIFQRLCAVPSRIRELEDLRRFRVGDVDVYAVLDVLVEDGRGGVVVLDWKTGEAHHDADIAVQLGVYGLYATQELGVPADRITAMHVNLRTGTETRHPVGPVEIEAAAARILESTSAMRARLRDVSQNVAAPEDYPELPADAAACRYCNFRGVCGRR